MQRHPFDPFSFIAGVIFVGLGLASLWGADLGLAEMRWALPIVLIVLGMALLLPLGRTMRDHDEDTA